MNTEHPEDLLYQRGTGEAYSEFVEAGAGCAVPPPEKNVVDKVSALKSGRDEYNRQNRARRVDDFLDPAEQIAQQNLAHASAKVPQRSDTAQTQAEFAQKEAAHARQQIAARLAEERDINHAAHNGQARTLNEGAQEVTQAIHDALSKYRAILRNRAPNESLEVHLESDSRVITAKLRIERRLIALGILDPKEVAISYNVMPFGVRIQTAGGLDMLIALDS